jgi:polar amino acid transport system substrate-binding protein
MKSTLRLWLITMALLGAPAVVSAQQTPDPRVADLVRAGTIRFALFLPGYAKDPVTGALRGVGTGAVTVQIAQALAERLGVKIELSGFPSPREVVQCLKDGACDLAYMGVESSRIGQVGFSPPLIKQDFTYLVPPGSPIRSSADADRPGVRVAVVRNHASTSALARTMKNAQPVAADVPDAAFALLRAGQADALAGARHGLAEYSTQLPGSRVLEDAYGANLVAMAVPNGQDGRLAYVSEFVEEAVASGLVQRAIERAGLRGYEVVSPAKPGIKH